MALGATMLSGSASRLTDALRGARMQFRDWREQYAREAERMRAIREAKKEQEKAERKARRERNVKLGVGIGAGVLGGAALGALAAPAATAAAPTAAAAGEATAATAAGTSAAAAPTTAAIEASSIGSAVAPATAETAAIGTPAVVDLPMGGGGFAMESTLAGQPAVASPMAVGHPLAGAKMVGTPSVVGPTGASVAAPKAAASTLGSSALKGALLGGGLGALSALSGTDYVGPGLAIRRQRELDTMRASERAEDLGLRREGMSAAMERARLAQEGQDRRATERNQTMLESARIRAPGSSKPRVTIGAGGASVSGADPTEVSGIYDSLKENYPGKGVPPKMTNELLAGIGRELQAAGSMENMKTAAQTIYDRLESQGYGDEELSRLREEFLKRGLPVRGKRNIAPIVIGW